MKQSLMMICLLLLFIGQLVNGQSAFNYIGTPDSTVDRSISCFSDQGAWFAYSLPDSVEFLSGFSGPFLMTQQNGRWISPSLSRFDLVDDDGESIFNWSEAKLKQHCKLSYLQQSFRGEQLEITQQLIFLNDETACIRVSIQNKGEKYLKFKPKWYGHIDLQGIQISTDHRGLKIISDNSDAIGFISVPGSGSYKIRSKTKSYEILYSNAVLQPEESVSFYIGQSFYFGEDDFDPRQPLQNCIAKGFDEFLSTSEREKLITYNSLWKKVPLEWKSVPNKRLLTKSLATLQNNWRSAAGELKHGGLFPSYHQKWFHGFWAWDSWKHAAALAGLNTELAREQILAMYDFQLSNGFVPDCVFRDTRDEKHNYRNTKPPLSAWAIWRVYAHSQDRQFLKEVYPLLAKYHYWWYKDRDCDQDGICEYGSTDGTVVAARWESGMDNAVRFDDSFLVKGGQDAWSLGQESVDLNAFLFAEKQYMIKMCKELGLEFERLRLLVEAQKLARQIQEQFWDEETQWFYDTDLSGDKFIKDQGPEAWITLWAGVASVEQAEQMLPTLLDTSKFYTKLPFPSLSAEHEKFEPANGYWRGPVWLDQAYFAIAGMRRYSFEKEANQATGRLLANLTSDRGSSLRENYNPLTAEGLKAEHFSWTASSIIEILTATDEPLSSSGK